MIDTATDMARRIQRYWYVDGFGELIGGGGMCLILSIYFFVQTYFGDDAMISNIFQVGLFLVLVGGFAFVRKMVSLMKVQVTYPRTGFVEYKVDGRNRLVMGIMSFLIAAALAFIFINIARRVDGLDAMTAMTGTGMGLILFIKQVRSAQVGRFYVLSAFSLALGIALSFSGFERGYNLGLFYGTMSLAFAISGGLTLKNYLQANPLQPEADHG